MDDQFRVSFFRTHLFWSRVFQDKSLANGVNKILKNIKTASSSSTALCVASRKLQMRAPSDTLTLATKSAQNPVQEVLPDPQNPLIPLNFLMSHLSSLGQRQTNYAHVDTQINVENLNLNIGLSDAAFLLEPPTSLTRTVENYYRQTHHTPPHCSSRISSCFLQPSWVRLSHLCHWHHLLGHSVIMIYLHRRAGPQTSPMVVRIARDS